MFSSNPNFSRRFYSSRQSNLRSSCRCSTATLGHLLHRRLSALRLGLRFQEVNLIKKSLKTSKRELRHDAQWLIMDLLPTDIGSSLKIVRCSIASYILVMERFVISLIDSETERLCGNEKESKMFAELMTTKRSLLTQLSDDLNRLRTIWFYLNKGEDEIVTSTSTSDSSHPTTTNFLSSPTQN